MLKRFPVHTLFFAIYPILALFGHNITEVTSSDVIRSLLVSLAGALVLFALARLLLRDTLRAGLVVTLFLLLFFTYGQVYNLLKEGSGIALLLARHRYLLALFGGLFVLGLVAIFMGGRHYPNANLTLNVIGLVLLVFPLYQIASYSLINPVEEETATTWTPQVALKKSANPSGQPDVYYVILDGYSRADEIKSVLHFDNTGFVNQLQDLGFVVAQCSRSNYVSTELSLASSLNMEPLTTAFKWANDQGITKQVQPNLIAHNQVRLEFKSLGYKIVAFNNQYPWLRWTDADLFLGSSATPFATQWITPFEKTVLDTTPISVYMDWQVQTFNDKFTEKDHPQAYFISQEEYKLSELPKIAKIADPTFTYIHILIPHPPFIFSPNGIETDPGYYGSGYGNPINDHYFQLGYVNEIQYDNQRIIPILAQILKDSSTPPIIVIQGDHGFGKNRFPILNAYYLPGGGSQKVYPTISPINTFRLVFDTYFGGSYGLLPDLSYTDKTDQETAPELNPQCQ